MVGEFTLDVVLMITGTVSTMGHHFGKSNIAAIQLDISTGVRLTIDTPF